MKIFDCFKFFNELELLDLRLMVLSEFVDYFILVEADKTHTGKPKDFIFETNKDKFQPYLDKIIYIKVEDLPDYSIGDIWKAENFQRNCITRGLSNAKTGDKIIVSDIDEIPNPDVLKMHLSRPQPVTMEQYLFYYHVNCLQAQGWNGSIMATYGSFESPQQLRNIARGGFNSQPNGGWHYSFMGGAERIKTKVENIAESHLIINGVGDIKQIQEKLNTQQDLWGRTEEYAKKELVDITTNLLAPKCIKEFIKKYPAFYNGTL